MKIIPAIAIIALFVSCKSGKDSAEETNITDTTNGRNVTDGQTSIDLIGETDSLPEMPVIGIAQNHKDGAVLDAKSHLFYIQDLHSWEDRYLGNPVRVWGDVEIRYDAPVFLDTAEIVSQGIPVESEEELKRQSKRYWIVNAKYELVRP
jgi:hypothetical protein